MGKHISVGDIVASKLVKSWGKPGKVTATYGPSRSKKFDVTWTDGTAVIGTSSRAICFVSELGPKPVPGARSKKRAAEESHVESDGTDASAGDSSEEDDDDSTDDEIDDGVDEERSEFPLLSRFCLIFCQ